MNLDNCIAPTSPSSLKKARGTVTFRQTCQSMIQWFVESAFNQYAPAQTELGILYQYGLMATAYRLEVFDGKTNVPF